MILKSDLFFDYLNIKQNLILNFLSLSKVNLNKILYSFLNACPFFKHPWRILNSSFDEVCKKKVHRVARDQMGGKTYKEEKNCVWFSGSWACYYFVIANEFCGELSLLVQYATTCTFGPAQGCNSKKNLKDLVKRISCML